MALNASAFGTDSRRSSALLTMPCAIVCSESRSTAAASASASSSLMPARVVISTTRNSPRVSVPVLSKNTALRLRASSSPRLSRTSKPFLAPSVVEMATTSGMASPSACGHAITRTVTTRSITYAAGAPAMNHPTSVRAAATTATIVSPKAALSASACARERDVCAWATSRMMPASAVFSPVPVTSTRREPEPFTVPAMTWASRVLATGRDSPVIIDSLTSLVPSRTVPSAGMLAPGRTSIRSPTRKSEAGTSSGRSPTSRVAVSGMSLASSFSAPCA